MRNWSLIAITITVLASTIVQNPVAHAQDAAPGTYPVTLPPHTFQAVVNYLKRQPWEDVQPLMAALAEAAQASAPRPPAKQPPAPDSPR
ncbi:hypothetical protein [Rhodopila sp.]|uniref:hypothetical protein n=1 Tax=Rhodopila sp. TaxID=2480087 RepID=UPI003D0DC719